MNMVDSSAMQTDLRVGRTARRKGIIALAMATLVVASVLPASTAYAVEDFGNWSNVGNVACPSGFVCWWPSTGVNNDAVKSTTRDSDFTNNNFANGWNMNDQVATIHNNFVSATTIRLCRGIGYATPNISLAKGEIKSDPWFNNPNGTSSYKAASCT